MTARFKDHFSRQAADYARYRPGYPDRLFAYLAQTAPGTGLAWDVGTGSGQAAVGLARHFRTVVASDPSAGQLQNAQAHPGVEYRVEPAEHSSLGDHSADLVTVGQALHWFDLDSFYREVRRVAAPAGLLAVWTYGLMDCTPEVDRCVRRFYSETVGPYWPPERALVESGYRDIPFPFAPVPAPPFAMEAQWDLGELMGYLGTWSATRRYIEERGSDPRQPIADELSAAWGSPRMKRRIQWPLSLKLGCVV